MLLRQIEYFLRVVNTGSFSQAAEDSFISQSAISQQIKALENELDAQLLLRHNRTFSLTPAGEVFYRKATVLLSDLDQLKREVRNIADKDHSSFRIGYLICYSGRQLLDATAQFSASYPEIDLSIIQGNHEDLFHALHNDEVDLVLSDQRRAFSDEYVNCELVRCRCMIEITAHHPFASLSRLDVSDLKNTTCILVANPSQRKIESTYYRDIVGLTGDYIYAETLPDARMMVASGKGFLPVEDISDDVYFDRSIARIPLYKEDRPVMRNYCAFYKKKNRSTHAELFARILLEQFT